MTRQQCIHHPFQILDVEVFPLKPKSILDIWNMVLIDIPLKRGGKNKIKHAANATRGNLFQRKHSYNSQHFKQLHRTRKTSYSNSQPITENKEKAVKSGRHHAKKGAMKTKN